LRLATSGWTVRVGRGSGDRPALEVYDGTLVVDVCVATTLSVPVLRGAWRSPRGAAPWALAWGRLPADAPGVTARFTAGGRNPAAREIAAVVIEGAYWVAETAGGWSRVTVHAGPVLVGARLRRSSGR
jgi:hypothetical protein